MREQDIRLLHTLQEMEDAVDLQRSYWGTRPGAVVPGHMLFTIAQHGGHVLGAFEGEGAQLVAILVGMPGLSPVASGMSSPYLLSKRMVVHVDWRKRGLALRLKLAQRERALSQGISLVRWTFDPLLAANAWLNLHRLGARATRFCEDYFGPAGAGGLADKGSPDRLQVDWQLDSERVCALVAGESPDADPGSLLSSGAPTLNRACLDERGLPRPGRLDALPPDGPALLELPHDFPALLRRDARLAQEWRLQLRAALRSLFAAGHVLQDCVRGTLDGRERLFYVSAPVTGEGDP
ncbi:MAG: hypothetical protein OXG07_11880 [Anaerolineaceae bacterium]|nr:hypothetical protein [Anaerolineaceae bacterium]MCY3905640.1 hypothetical protein [Anaerolineaceae bacterium]